MNEDFPNHFWKKSHDLVTAVSKIETGKQHLIIYVIYWIVGSQIVCGLSYM